MIFYFAVRVRIAGSFAEGMVTTVGAGGATSAVAASHVRNMTESQGFEIMDIREV